MKKTTLLFLIMPFILAVLVRVIIVNCFSISGNSLSDLEYKRDVLVKDNLDLKKQNSYYSSLNYIKSEAQKDGFTAMFTEFLEAPSLAVR